MSNGKNIFITSNNQMGGITAHTVNLGPTARQMNDSLGEPIKQNIPVAAKVTVVAVLGDGEAFGFANQVLAWMKSNGYTNVNGVNQTVYSKPVTGQSIIKKNDNEYELIIGTHR
jgi:hypothetical protein